MSDPNEQTVDWQEELMNEVVTKWILGRSKPEKVNTRVLFVSLGISFNFRNHAALKRRRGKFVLGKLGKVQIATVRVPPGTLQLESVLAVAARTDIKYCLGIGALGSAQADLNVGDIVLPTGAYCGDGLTQYYPGDDIARPDDQLVDKTRAQLEQDKLPYRTGNVYTTASLCTESDEMVERLQTDNYLGMETQVSAFYRVAAHYGLKSVALLTVSDNPVKREIYFRDRELLKKYQVNQNKCFAALERVAGGLDSHDQQKARRRAHRRRG